MSNQAPTFEDAWDQMLIEGVMLRDHLSFYTIQSSSAIMRNPLVDHYGPGVVYVKMLALLDEAIEQYLEDHGIRVERPLRNNLHGRIETLARRSALLQPAELHRIRDTRNGLAHEADARTTWEQLEADTAMVHAELQHLGLVGPQRTFATFTTRVPELDAGPAIAVRHHFTVGVKDDTEAIRAEVSWTIDRYRLGWSRERVLEAQARGEHVPVGLKD